MSSSLNNTTSKEKVSFSFGKNWKNYLSAADEISFQNAAEDILQWLGEEFIKGKSVIDFGCGSGIHSMVFYSMNAAQLLSVDADIHSVEATQTLWKRCKEPSSWSIKHGSVLDQSFIQSLPAFDLVYSWGVLHHTGAMWNAIENIMKLVKPGGFCWISIYVKGPNYKNHLQLKHAYNRAGWLKKKWMLLYNCIVPLMIKRIHWRQNPFTWNERGNRGMFVYYDMIDWLGGLPYEVASTDEIIQKFSDSNFETVKIKEFPEGYCNVYLFKKKI